MNVSPIGGTVREVFEYALSDKEIDEALAKSIDTYLHEFLNRNKDHASFFGGVLLGVEVVRFLESDKNNWFDNILQADEETLREYLHALPGINKEWKVSSNVMSLSCVWLVHKFFHSSLPAEMKMKAMMNVLIILQIKGVTSILFNFFRFPADKQVAEATYAALNMKFILKETGSWLNLLTYRAKEILSRTSPNYNAISRMDKDKEVVDMLNTIHGALKSYIKNMRGVMEHVRLTGGKIKTTTAVAGIDGEEILKDRTKGPQALTNYIKSILSDRNSFIRENLLHIVLVSMPTINADYLTSALEWLSSNYFGKEHKKVEEIINLTMLHSYSYLTTGATVSKANSSLINIISKMRGAYTSSRSSDADLLELRKLVEEFIKPVVSSRTPAVLSATRTGVLLYIVARAHAMKHYAVN